MEIGGFETEKGVLSRMVSEGCVVIKSFRLYMVLIILSPQLCLVHEGYYASSAIHHFW